MTLVVGFRFHCYEIVSKGSLLVIKNDKEHGLTYAAYFRQNSGPRTDSCAVCGYAFGSLNMVSKRSFVEYMEIRASICRL